MIKSTAYKDSFLNTGSPSKIDFAAWRLLLVYGTFIFLTALIVGRLIQLHITDTDFLRAQGNARMLRTVDIPSFRGLITDRRNIPLAISTPVHAVWANPQHFAPTKEQ